MGNTEPKNANNRQVQVLHEKFKMVEVLENLEEMILTIPYEQKSDIVEWQKLLKNVKDCDPQFLLMPKKYMITEEGLCGSSGVIKIVYDCFVYSFEQQISNHSEKFKYFQQAEIWYLLFAIISSVKEMDRLSMKVGDIRPHNIFVNENGQVKLSGMYSWPKEAQNYLKTSYDKIVTYLSPQQLRQCRMGEKAKRSHIIGEAFSVGLTLLHTCLLKDLDELYNVKKFQFNVQKLQYEINELKKLTYWNQQKGTNQKYSQQLINIITGLLEINQEKRLSTLDLFNQLEPHAEEILNLREFQIPKFNIDSPIKQQHQSILVSSLQHHRSSPQYSSIQKKELNQPESIAFSSNYPIGLISTKDVNTIQQSINQSFIPQRKTPQKKTTSKQKMQVSLSNERSSLFAQTQQIPQIPRQSVSRQKFNSNPQVNFSVPTSQIQNKGLSSQVPSTYQYTAEFKTYDTQFQPFKPIIGSNYPTVNQRKYEAPPLSYTTSNYVTYQQKYEIPSQLMECRAVGQPSNLSYVQSQTPQFSYKPSVPQPQMASGGSYPFTKNIQFTKSDYTVFDQSNLGTEFSHRPSLSGAIQPGSQYTTNIYHTSTVKPVVPGQTSFGSGTQTRIFGEPSQLLKRIDQQLNKSKQMYSNGSTF